MSPKRKCYFCGAPAVGRFKTPDGLKVLMCQDHSKGRPRVDHLRHAAEKVRKRISKRRRT